MFRCRSQLLRIEEELGDIAVALAGTALFEPAPAFLAYGSVFRGPDQLFLTVSAYRTDER